MTSTTTKSAFWQGVRDGAPFLLVIAPFGTLFGVVATEAGLAVFETLAFSVVVIAGAAQFTALQLMREETPTLIVLVSALAVNLRMAMYSASLTPYLGAAPVWTRAVIAYFLVDQTYACAAARFEREPAMPVSARIAYFFGVVAPVCPLWYGFTLVGAYLGDRIPQTWALDFAVPITFLALIAQMLRSAAHVTAALVAIVTAIVANGLPFNLGLIVAGLAGMIAGAQVEVSMQRKADPT